MDRHVMIFANTRWEADALVAVLSNAQARPQTHAELGKTPPLFNDYYFPPTITSRPTITIPGVSLPVTARLAFEGIEVWCVADLTGGSLGSLEKARALKVLADAGPAPDVVIAFGTAAFPDSHIYDGCAVIGSNVFNFDPNAEVEDKDRWKDESIGNFQNVNKQQAINVEFFKQLRGRLRLPIESRFLIPPISGSHPPFLLASGSYVAVSDVNVASVDDYAWADRDAIQALFKANPKATPGSVETTHGIIHAAVKSKIFLFVSAIANRLGYFNMEAAPRNYAQDFAVAHNAAIALAWMLPAVLAAPSSETSAIPVSG